MSALQDTCASLLAAFEDSARLRAHLAAESRKIRDAAAATASAGRRSVNPRGPLQVAESLEIAAGHCVSAARLIGAAEEAGRHFVRRTVGGSYGGGGSAVGGDVARWAGGVAVLGAAATVPAAGVAGLPNGWEMVPLTQIDTSDSPVHGAANFGKGYTPEDLAWAHQALHEVVLPALARGDGPDYFAQRDAAEGRVGTRSYSDTYGGFFHEGQAIRLDRGPDGTYTVANGYHRIWVARLLGLDAVPARTR